MNNPQGIITPHYTPTHTIFPSEATAPRCLSFASLYWEETTSTGRRSQEQYGPPESSATADADRTCAALLPFLGLELASHPPFPLTG